MSFSSYTHSTTARGAIIALLLVAIVGLPLAVDLSQGVVDISYANAQTQSTGSSSSNPLSAIGYAFTTCSVFTVVNIPACIFRMFMEGMSTLLIYLSTWILELSGILFDWLIQHTIIEFGTLYGSVKDAVEQAWTAFRDIANILIIGMFTFIAIATILGLQTYNARKLVARVLIIAVLINFSLLFTKIIIDGSNFTAQQVYAAAALGSVGQGGNNQNGAAAGIAGQFFNLLGVQTLAQTASTVSEVGTQSDSTTVVILHGIFTFLVIIGTAVVLLYGSFLIVSRAIMLIFLLGTAAIAFASYLIPKWEKGSYGWDAWWSSLLWCASLAPILMLLLWMTLNVSFAIHSTSHGSLGGLVANPTNASNVSSLFAYVIILGLLFTTFKLSSAWANKIGGFNFAAFVPGLAISLGSRVSGAATRYTVGLGAGAAARATRRFAARQRAANRPILAKGIYRAAAPLAKVASKDFNLMNTSFGKAVAKTAGLKGNLAGTTKLGGIEGVQKKQAEEYAKMAEGLQISKEQKDKIRQGAIGEVEQRQQFREGRNLLRGLRQTGEANLRATEQSVATNKQALEQEHRDAQATLRGTETSAAENKNQIRDRFEQPIRDLATQLANATTPEEGNLLNSRLQGMERQRDGELRQEERRIEEARAAVEEVRGRIRAEDSRITRDRDQLNRIGEQERELTTRIEREADTAIRARYPNLDQTTEQVASEQANTRMINLFGNLISEQNDHLAELARKHTRDSAEDKRLKRLFNSMAEQPATTLPPTPPAGAPDTH